MIQKLARINKANLEIQDRGILNFWIMVDYEDVSFKKFPELYKEFELNYNKGNYIVNTSESRLHFIA